eukprot:scaffold5038_cov21-Prasinocladus_malaysianus.AAC.2
MQNDRFKTSRSSRGQAIDKSREPPGNVFVMLRYGDAKSGFAVGNIFATLHASRRVGISVLTFHDMAIPWQTIAAFAGRRSCFRCMPGSGSPLCKTPGLLRGCPPGPDGGMDISVNELVSSCLTRTSVAHKTEHILR